ncbi:hypothetical protein [Motilimonas cestriensis]|uniref:hypothetical protein n=1 Tax=Motilimonas cestriensis TaxID=2742685 RepID=UPI003DA249C0
MLANIRLVGEKIVEMLLVRCVNTDALTIHQTDQGGVMDRRPSMFTCKAQWIDLSNTQ